MITAILLAAGESKRMGQPKMLLPWGDSTVLGHILAVLKAAEVEDILVVTGGAREQVEAICKQASVRAVFNADYASGEMLSSIQAGVRDLTLPPPPLRGTSPKSEIGIPVRKPNKTIGFGGGREGVDAALLVLGDQPQVEKSSVRAVLAAYRKSGSNLVVPSYHMRRGHPWLVAHPLWDEILRMKSPHTPRDFLTARAAGIEYVNLDTPTILADLDTPEDYLNSRP
ncbi:MAG: nucleotidyltransferase family protein [Chloroflexota bacterium]